MEILIQLVSTLLNKTNVTINNLAFLIGIVLTTGLIVFGLLSLIFGSFFSFIVIAGITTFFGYRTITANEEAVVEERTTPRVY